MQKRDDVNRSNPPIVPSQVAANSYLSHWLAENRFNLISDADGLQWNLTVQTISRPDDQDVAREKIEIIVRIGAAPLPDQLLATGALDAQKDERLIEMINSRPVPMTMKPLRFFAHSEDQARQTLADELPKIRTKFGSTSLVDIKRNLIGQFVDSHNRFGAHFSD